MKTALLGLAVSVCLVGGAAAAPMSDADCQAAWTGADKNSDGMLDAMESARFSAALRAADRPAAASSGLEKASYLDACRTGLLALAIPEPGAPFSGANSFTEGQAKERLESAGFTSVSGLQKDETGIWRGTATLTTQTVSVAVDFKGNIVSN